MQKRERRVLVPQIAFLEIFILVLASVAFVFIIGSASFVSAGFIPTGSFVAKAAPATLTRTNVAAGSSQSLYTSVAAGQALPSGTGVVTTGGIYYHSVNGLSNTLYAEPNGLVTYQSVGGGNTIITQGSNSFVADQVSAAENSEVVYNPASAVQSATPPPASNGLLPEPIMHIFNGQLFSGTAQEGVVGSSAIAPTTTAAGTYYPYLNTGDSLSGIGITNALVAGLAWAGVAFLVGHIVGSLFGLSKTNTNALSYAFAGGAGTYGTLASEPMQEFFAANANGWGGLVGSGGPLLIGVGVAAIIFTLMYQDETTKTATFQCLPFEPPLGGSDCEKCNKDLFRPCTEYRCKALGQACQLLNPGTTSAMCAWVNPKAVNQPIINSWADALAPAGLEYIPGTATNPPSLGFQVKTSSGGCLPAFTPLRFGITTNEPAQCKIDYNHTSNFDSMQFYFGETNYFLYNHTEVMSLPNPNILGNGTGSPEFKNNGIFNLYVRCRDANNNTNVAEYNVNFCVDKGPDVSQPIIEGSSILDGSPVQYNVQQVPIQIFVNEPSECKWSRTDKNYNDMENQMTCTTKGSEINAQLQYPCSSTLTGITNQANNTFYFRCKDQPGAPDKDRNVMSMSFPLSLEGTNSLVILSSGPNGTITGSTGTIPVNLSITASDGANQGNAICAFSTTGNTGSYIQMYQTNSYQSSQEVDLTNGSYKFFFKCIDAGGNEADSNTTFTVFTDNQPPQITRVYKEGSQYLKVVTNKDASCSYSLTDCNFNEADGITMKNVQGDLRDQYTQWASNLFYIRCRDTYGNEPPSNTCSAIVNPIQLSSTSTS